MATLYHPATVDQDQLQAIQSLENDLGKVLVAMQPESNDYAKLTAQQLASLRAVEKQLGMVIVAFDVT